MDFKTAIDICHVRSAIYRKSNGVRHWKNHSIPIEERVSVEDQSATDWMEYDPRDNDDSSLFSFND